MGSNAAMEVDNLADEYGGVPSAGRAPKFSVGDRVRTKGYAGTIWDGEGVVTTVGTACNIVVVNGSTGGFVDSELELVERPVAAVVLLQIEAGKYYRTRDGQKVGPAARDIDHQYSIEGFVWRVGTYTYKDNGAAGFTYDDDDLIAEWVDEPVAVHAAEPSAEQQAEPKFKVGDRVRLTADNSGFGVEGDLGEILNINDDRYVYIHFDRLINGDHHWFADIGDIQLVTVADSPVANDNTPTPEPTYTPTALGRAYADGYTAGLAAATAQAA